jgi:hypothetical protein
MLTPVIQQPRGKSSLVSHRPLRGLQTLSCRRTWGPLDWTLNVPKGTHNFSLRSSHPFRSFRVSLFVLAMHSLSSSFSFSSFIQYAFFAVIAYVLAGAPLSQFISNASSSGPSQRDGNISKGKLENLVFPEKDLHCGEHAYKGVYILNREPLVVYIEGFLSTQEARHVVNIRFVTCFWLSPFHHQNILTPQPIALPTSSPRLSGTLAKNPLTRPSVTLKRPHSRATKQ